MNTKFSKTIVSILVAALMALAVAFSSIQPAQAASCTVTSALDSGSGSLRAFLAIKGKSACSAISFNSDMTIALASPLVLSGSMTIDGAGHAVIISGDSNGDGSGETYLFDVPAGISASFQHLTFEKGAVGKPDKNGYFMGGAIWNAGTVSVANSTFSGNHATNFGGAIFNQGSLAVTGSLFYGNHAQGGGAIFIHLYGTASISNTTFTGNNATGSGGAIGSDSSGIILTVTNSTFSGNSAQSGGGIFNYVGTTSIKNTILANNGSDDCHLPFASDSTGNLSDDYHCTPGFTLSLDILLGPLGNYGGPTQTIPLLPGSAAIDAGDSAYCPVTDQRGITRPQGAGCDIGAFESRGFSLAADSGSDQLAALNTAFAEPLVVTVSSAYGEPVDGGQVRFIQPYDGASAYIYPSRATISGGQASVSVTANGNQGSYNVVASAAGAPSADFFLVNGCWDNPVVTSDLDSGHGSLRQAIAWACPGDTITFAGDTPIHLASELTLTRDVTIDGGTHNVVISGDMTGNGTGDVRIFWVNDSVTANLKNMTLEKGYAYSSNVAYGGAIYNSSGTLTVTNITFSSNSVHGQNGDLGGAIWNGSGGMLMVTNSTFSSNTLDNGGGGGIENAGTLTVTNSTFSGNSAPYGGGIYNSGTLTVTGSTFSGNSANEGGAIRNMSQLAVTNSTFTGNNASSYGGAVSNDNRSGSEVTFANSTFATNSAGNQGGALYTNGSAQFTNNTFVENYAGTSSSSGGTYFVGSGSLALYNNIISSSAAYACYAASPSALTGSNNLNNRGCGPISSVFTYLPGRIFSGSANPSSILLGTLGDNGGPTQTFALLPGSAAIDAGDDSTCPATDQRGVARPIGAHCDIGAVESPLLEAITVTSAADDGSGSLRHAILGLAPGGTITFAGDTTIHLTSDLNLQRNVTIDGGTHNVIISGDTGNDGTANTLIFDVYTDVVANFNHLTLEKGSGYYGGAIFNYHGIVAMTNSTFSGNSANAGGAITNYGSLTVTNSTFSGNSSANGAGAIANVGMLTVTNSTFSGNSTPISGGAIWNVGTATFYNSIIASNSGGNCSSNLSTSSSSNLADDSSCGTSGFSVSSSILLGPVGSYGGSMQTIPLVPGSPAIDAGNPSYCPATDQRGLPRVGACDIGAFESQGFSLAVSAGDNQTAYPSAAFTNPLEVTVSSALGEPLEGGQVTFSAPVDGASATFSGSPAAISNGKASVTATANSLPGAYTVTASANGGLNTLQFSLANTQPVATVSLTSSLTPSVYSDPVTFTARVTAGSGLPIPTGTVSFSIDSGSSKIPLDANGSASFTTNSLNGGLHQVVVNYSGDDTYDASSSTPLRQEVYQAPVVTTHPAGQTVTEGSQASFSAIADGYPALSVQWQLSTDGYIWADLPGATGMPYTFTASYAQNGYQYRVIFSNKMGSATSKPASLTVQQLPTITQQPENATVDEGSPASFSAAASSPLALTVQWQVSSDKGGTWADLPGATSTTLTFTASYSQNSYQYRAVFTNAAGSVTSQAATLTVSLSSGTGSISGLVFNDLNGNGTKDRIETGLADWTVQLMDANDNLLQSVQTDETGKYNYSFTSLSSHVFRVRLAQPLLAGYVQTTADPADIDLADGQAVTGINFGAVVSADLELSMDYTYDSAAGTIIYTLTVTNDGPAEAAAVSLKDTLSRYVGFVSFTSSQGTCSKGKISLTCNLDTLASGSSATVTITVNRTSTRYAILNTATVSSSIFDLDKGDNSVTVTVQ